jgi:hypothetical protein
LVNLPPRLQANVDRVKDIEEAAIQFAETFKYPIDANGNVLDINALNHLYPDLLPGLIHHFVKAGWRRVEDKRFIKSRRVIGPGCMRTSSRGGRWTAPTNRSTSTSNRTVICGR